MRKHLLVVGGQNRSIADAALEADVTLFQVQRLVKPEQMACACRSCVFDIASIDEAVSLARAIHAYHPFDGVISFLDAGLLAAANIAEALAIPGNPLKPVAASVDKLAMRALLNEHGISPVRFQHCETVRDVENFFAETGTAIVLKPACGSGSMGVSKITKSADIEDAFRWCRRASNDPLIAETYISGVEYGVDTLTLDGVHEVITITQKRKKPSSHFIEVGHCVPAPVPALLRAKMAKIVTDVFDLIGHRIGAGHTELRIAADGEPVIIETHTRAPGDYVDELMERVFGVNVNRVASAHLLGSEYHRGQGRGGAAAVGFLAYESMTVGHVGGIEEAQKIPGVVRVESRLRPGQKLGRLASSKDRQGYVLAVGSTAEEAWQTVDAGLASIQVTAGEE